MTVPYAFANLSGNIALAKLDSNFNTPITIGNTSVLLGNTVTTLNNLTLANVTITSGTSNVTNVNVTNVTVTNLTATLANVTTLNVASAFITSANIGTLALTNALPVSSGGTGQVTFPANSVLLGNGTGGIATVAPGNVGNVLTSIGGVWVSNVAVSGAAAGANTQVQYNNSGALGASANLTFNGTTLTANTLNLTNALGTTYGGTGLTSFTANGVVYASSSSALTTGSALVFNGTNFGLGVTPSAWSGVNAFEMTAGTSLGSNASVPLTFLNANCYYNGSNWIYKTSYFANQYIQDATEGKHKWFNATSGTAGNAITFTQAMTLDTSGNLLVGNTTETSTTTPVRISSGGTYGTTLLNGMKVLAFDSVSGTKHGMGIIAGALYLNTGDSTNITFGISNAEKMRLDTSGNLLVGTTTFRARCTVEGNSLLTAVPYDSNDTRNDASSSASFYFRRLGTIVGDISTTTTATAYNTSSDYRLKENIQPMQNALAKVAALKPVTYNWKSNGSDGEGFIAHELAEVCPHAVVGEKDAVNEDGSIKSQGIDTSFLVATLTAALQEAHSLIKDLQTRVAQLEAK